MLYGVLTVTDKNIASENANASGWNKQLPGTQKYMVGSFVQIFSSLTQEDYAGIITSISNEEVIIRLGTGTRLRVYVQQIRDRR